MEKQMQIEDRDALYGEFKRLAVKGRGLSAADKARVKDIVEQLEISHKFNTRCASCYTDAIVLVLSKLRKLGVSDAVSRCNYKITCNGGQFVMNGRIYSNYTLTDEEAESLLKLGGSMRFLISKKG